MFFREFVPHQLFESLAGSRILRHYCRSRSLTLPQDGSSRSLTSSVRRWREVLRQFKPDQQARVERDLAQVTEMGEVDAVDHLLDAAGTNDQPPPSVPRATPLALWFLVHRPDLFREVKLHHEVQEVPIWRIARTSPNLPLEDLPRKTHALAESLREFFQISSTGMRFCVIEADRTRDAYSFKARIADRARLIEGFRANGSLALIRHRPALTIHFTYRPHDGLVFVNTPLQSADRRKALLDCFGQAVFGVPFVLLGAAFDLDRLKRPFHPMPDAPDMERVRVKSLHLRYPARLGSRLFKLETLASDAQGAVEELLVTHAGTGIRLEELRICHAELQIQLRIDGRSKPHTLMLWPDRIGFSHVSMAERLWNCLNRWGLTHVR